MTQRDKMRQLFQLHGESGREEILRHYAKAEASGEVRRKKKGVLTTEELRSCCTKTASRRAGFGNNKPCAECNP